MRTICFLIPLLLLSFSLQANNGNKRKIQAQRIATEFKLDGVLNEPFWNTTEKAIDYSQLEPTPGDPASEQTEAMIVYDDQAIYIGAILYEESPTLVAKQLFERDNLGGDIETDWLCIAFDTYMDGNNGFAFFITPSGVQMDMKLSANGDDVGWDAVWDAAIQINEQGWVVEMRIPYSALRFPDREVHQWHVNIGRKIFRLQEESWWSYVDPQVNGFFSQAGIVEGIHDIKSPVRLSATPFIALYGENFYDKNNDPKSAWGSSITGGMDLKYGISDAFTLDMTLIPDFGQVQSDNEVLNLSPFEVRFDENRQFFTEGTELFNKGGLFYSRRVGGTPFYRGEVYNQLDQGEIIVDNPVESQLLNATKISGRTKSGTGLGFFNAIADKEYATIENIEGEQRQVLTNPLTNYNVLVVDQNLKNNSYITLLNTNVWRSGEAYEANVTGTQFSLKDKTNTYSFSGSAALSQKYFSSYTDLGYRYFLEFGKRSGNVVWEVGYSEESYDYDPNDLGFLFNNNERRVHGFIEYNHYEPFGRFLRMGGGFFTRAEFLHKFMGDPEQQVRDNLFSSYGVNFWWWAKSRNQWRWNFWTYFEPIKSYNYFEPRVPGRFYERPEFINNGFNFETDQRKAFSFEFAVRYRHSFAEQMNELAININPEIRLSDKFSVSYVLDVEKDRNNVGYVTVDGLEDIIFGKRDIVSVLNFMRASYTFNRDMAFSFRLRHNWTNVQYNSFHLLNPLGKLEDTSYNESEDINFNAFTIDAVYRWRFAPGSDIFVVWKNSIIGSSENANIDFFDNLNNLFDNPVRNSLSIKFLYYLDYLKVKDAF